MPRLRARLTRERRGAAARGAPTMTALTALAEIVDASGAAHFTRVQQALTSLPKASSGGWT
jgi:hypothetical protein